MTFEKRKCKICGKEFQPRAHNSVYCSKTHKKVCKYCGEEFDCKNDVYYKRDCCSKKECKRKSKIEKMEEAAAKRYKKRKCPICGKEFQPKTENQIYCSTTHKKKCVICGKEFDAPSSYYEETNACSKSCNALLGQKTYFEKTGIHKGFQNKENREKAQKTFIKKYGTTNINKIPGVKEKREQTNLERYGTKNTLSKGSPIRDKIDKENLDNYGTTSPMGNPDIQAKARKTIKERYGVDYPLQDKEILNKTRSKEIYNIEDWNEFENFIKNNKNKYTMEDLMKYFNLNYDTIRRTAIEDNLTSYIKDFYKLTKVESDAIDEICNFLNIKKDEIRVHDRQQIAPKEIDILIPDLKLGFEVSPSFTHHLDYNNDYNYHYDKFLKAEKAGIDLITIFDWMDIEEVLETRNNLDLTLESITTNNAYGNYNWLKNHGYILTEELPPTINYYNNTKKELSTKNIKDKTNLRVADCGYRIWKRK